MPKHNSFFDHLDQNSLELRRGHHGDQRVANEYGHAVESVEFDYDEIDKNLGWAEPKPPEETARDQKFTDAADMLGAFAVWIASSQNLESAGRRALALAWTLRPKAFKFDTLTELAKFYGGHKQSYSFATREIFNLGRGLFTSRTMCAPQNRATYSRTSIAAHKRAGHKPSGKLRRRAPELEVGRKTPIKET